jgi:hypothetical protein
MSSLADNQQEAIPGPFALDLHFLTPTRRSSLLAMRPGDRLSFLRRHRLLPLARSRVAAPGILPPAALAHPCASEPAQPHRADSTDAVMGPVVGMPDRFRSSLSPSDRALAEVLERLEAAGIPALVLKGAALAHSLYESPDLRPRTDADVLVAQADLDRAGCELSRLGYRTAPASAHDTISTQVSFAANDPDVCAIDLHFALSNRPEFAASFAFSTLSAEAQALPSLSSHARGLHPSHALLLAVMHYYGHLPADERPAIWLFDIALLARSMSASTWAKVDQNARSVGICGLLAAAIIEARTWFDCPCPEPLFDAWQTLGAQEWRSARVESEAPPWRDLGLALRGLPNLAARARYLWRRAFPKIEWMRAQYGVETKAELARAYLRRLIHGVVRRVRKQA